MTDARRWLALDADMFGKRFTHDLYDRFGWAGIAVWVAFLCACKQSRIPGRIRVMNSAQAAHELGIVGWELVDPKGEPWDLEDFFTFTGRKKQTRRIVHGRRADSSRTLHKQSTDVVSTHWERWQKAAQMSREAERKRTSRKEKRPDGVRDQPGHDTDTARTNVRPDLDLDLDLDIPQTPPGVEPPGPRTNSRSNGTNPRARGTNPRALPADPPRPPIADWQPDPEPAEPSIDQGAVQALRKRSQQ